MQNPEEQIEAALRIIAEHLGGPNNGALPEAVRRVCRAHDETTKICVAVHIRCQELEKRLKELEARHAPTLV